MASLALVAFSFELLANLSLRQDTRSLRTESKERSAAGARRDDPYSTGEGGRRSQKKKRKKKTWNVNYN